MQGNDTFGTLRIVRGNGVTIDIPASANWRNSGGSTCLIGILPRPTSPITETYAGGSINITDGTVHGGTSVGGYLTAYGGATISDGDGESARPRRSAWSSCHGVPHSGTGYSSADVGHAYIGDAVVHHRHSGPSTDVLAALSHLDAIRCAHGTARSLRFACLAR